ncbi:MAG TPA: hypothetical protein VER11_11415 [Polyangiaceae bacterium]|nr:hypothetical protein [Polyangiaceae bacterium]
MTTSGAGFVGTGSAPCDAAASGAGVGASALVLDFEASDGGLVSGGGRCGADSGGTSGRASGGGASGATGGAGGGALPAGWAKAAELAHQTARVPLTK